MKPLITLTLSHPIEMMRPQKLVLLMLIERGWIARRNHFEPPSQFATLRLALARKPDRWRRYLTIPGAYVTIGHWAKVGAVKRVEAADCDLRPRFLLSDKGAEILRRLTPGMRAAASASYRAMIWKYGVLHGRRSRETERNLDRLRRGARGRSRKPLVEFSFPIRGRASR